MPKASVSITNFLKRLERANTKVEPIVFNLTMLLYLFMNVILSITRHIYYYYYYYYLSILFHLGFSLLIGILLLSVLHLRGGLHKKSQYKKIKDLKHDAHIK